MEHRSVLGLVLLLTVALFFLALACSGSDNNNNRVDDETDDDDNDATAGDDDDDDNDDNDDDTADDFPIQLVDGGAPGRNGVSMVRSADGTFHLAAVRGYSLIVYSWQEKDIAEEKVFTPAAEPILRQDADGNLCVVFLDPFAHVLRYADNRTGKWVTAAIQGHIADLETYSFALDANGKACVAYYDSTSVKILFATNRSGSWAMTAVGDAAPAPSGTAIGVDAAGAVHVAYDGLPAGSLYYATNASGSWATELVTANGYAPAMVLDSAGRPRLIYRASDEYKADNKLYYAVRDAGEWQVETAGEPNSWNYYHYNLALDSQEKAHISTHLLEGNGPGVFGDLYYLTNQSGEWIEEEIDLHIYSYYGQFTAIAVDEEDQPSIGYFSAERTTLSVVVKADGDWTFQTLDDAGFAEMPAIAVTSTGQAFVSYMRYKSLSLGGEHPIYVSKNKNTNWEKELVGEYNCDVTGYGLDQKLVVDSSGHAHLAFVLNISNDNLYYANDVAGFMTTQIIFAEEYAYISSCSMAVDYQSHAYLGFDFAGNSLYYKTNRAGQWEWQVISTIEGALPRALAMVANDEGVTNLIFNDVNGLNYTTNRSGEWVGEILDEEGGFCAAIFLDDNGHAHIAYSKGLGSNILKYATNESGEWVSTVVSSDTGATTIAIASTEVNSIKIGYYYASDSGPGGFYEAENSSGDWSINKLASCDNVLNGRAFPYWDVSLAIDGEGRIHAAYHFEGGLFYRVFDSSR